MRRLVALGVLLALLALPVAADTGRRTAFDPRFDINGDGAIDVLDLQILINVVLAGFYIVFLDFHPDGVLDINDVNVLVWVILTQTRV